MNKAKIGTFLYCLAAERTNPSANGINANGVLAVITPEFMPSAFSFSIIFSIMGVNLKIDHSLGLYFKDKGGNILVAVEKISFPKNKEDIEAGELNLPIEATGFVSSMDLKNVILREEGMYSTLVIFDDETLGEYEIYVKGKQCN